MSAESVQEVVGPAARFKAFKEEHHLAFELAFFFAGFLFDVLLLHRIDSTPLLIHQGLYLVLSAGLVFWDHRLHAQGREPTGWLGKVAQYRLWVMHFLLGTLLNAFMVFYFRASSGLSAFLFLVGLAALIFANELPRFRERGPIVRVMMLSFAVTSYLAYLLPVLWGELRSWQYVLAALIGSAATFGLWKVFVRFNQDPHWTFRRAVAPALALQGTLVVLYVAGVVPPVPLSLRHIGVYSNVTPEHGERGLTYHLEYEPASKLAPWREVAATFKAKAGAKAWVFVRIFAPARFHDEVAFAWEFDDPDKGWTPRGGPFRTRLSGGNEEGFRTFAYSTMGRPGTYRVRVLTADGREIGRTTFDFVEGEPEETHVADD